MKPAQEDVDAPTEYGPLSADQYYQILKDTEYFLRLSDGTKEDTWTVWVKNEILYGRRLIWTQNKELDISDLEMLLNDDKTTQLVVSNE